MSKQYLELDSESKSEQHSKNVSTTKIVRQINHSTYWKIPLSKIKDIKYDSTDLTRVGTVTFIKQNGSTINVEPNGNEDNDSARLIYNQILELDTPDYVKKVLLTKLSQNGIYGDQFSYVARQVAIYSDGTASAGGGSNGLIIQEKENGIIDIRITFLIRRIFDFKDKGPEPLRITRVNEDDPLLIDTAHFQIDPTKILCEQPFSTTYTRGGFFLGEHGREPIPDFLCVDTIDAEMTIVDDRILEYLPPQEHKNEPDQDTENKFEFI